MTSRNSGQRLGPRGWQASRVDMIWQTIQVPEMTSSRSYNLSAALKEQVKTLWKLARNGIILSAKTMQTRTALPTGTRRHLPATPALHPRFPHLHEMTKPKGHLAETVSCFRKILCNSSMPLLSCRNPRYAHRNPLNLRWRFVQDLRPRQSAKIPLL